MVARSPGQIARNILGRHFKPVGNAYRRIFVDLNKIVEFVDRSLPHGARILDIGGGDGALVDRLLNHRPDLAITMCDLAPSIGSFLSDGNRSKVAMCPATPFTEVSGAFEVVTLSDVVHHVPIAERDSFFELLSDCCRKWGCHRLILKDIEPRGWRAMLSLFADRHITGDAHVVLFSRSDFAEIAHRHFHGATRVSGMPDRPNYCEVLSW